MRVSYARAVLAGALGTGAVAWYLAVPPALAHAQDACVPETPESDDLRLTPTVGSPEQVTLDAPVIARFPATVDVHDAEPQALLELRRVESDGTEIPVDGRHERFAAQPNVLVFRPSGGLSPDSDYVGRVSDPSGLDMRELSFSTGTRRDEAKPRFRDSTLRLSASRSPSDCGAVRVDVGFLPAQDDGPRGSLEHLVYQSRGAALDAPVLRKRVRAAMDSEVSASFLLSEGQAVEPICVHVLAVDGTGRVSEDGRRDCFTPLPGDHFVGLCAAAPTGPVGPAALWLGSVLWLVWRRRRD